MFINNNMGKYLKLFKTHSEYQTYEQSGDMIKPNVSYCEDNNEVHYNPWTYAEAYLTFVALESGTFQLSTNAVSYSLDDGETWAELTKNTATPTVTAGNKIMWKGTLTPSSSAGIGTFSATGNFDVQGNPMSLLFGDDFKGQTDLTRKDYAFNKLFYNNAKVINARNLSLPATTLASNCYTSMFNSCINLTTAPKLPATTLASGCYSQMFEGCTSLTTAPSVLPATTLAQYCYNSMFSGCTSLTTAPELPATALKNGCYGNMFNGCTSLTTAPVLPAETLAVTCYLYMFGGCTSLVNAPVLPATTLATGCYLNMFQGCTSLTTAPELRATTLADSCYNSMFSGCTSLNYIKAMFTTAPGETYTYEWVSGVSSTGTFVKNSAATWTTTGANGVPRGWTVVTE